MSEPIDVRQTVQRGVFTIHGDVDGITKEPSSAYLTHVLIDWKFADKLALFLDNLGVSRTSMFPGLDNLSIDLKKSFTVNGEEKIPYS